MKNFKYLLIIIFCLVKAINSFAQDTLPGITVKNYNGKIIVSWQNDYKMPVSNILIQRSYDSLKNYTTIGSVLNPQNRENGYADANPPYTKMYYRVSVSFDGGAYVITRPERPVKEREEDNGYGEAKDKYRYPWQVNPSADSGTVALSNGITYPSQRIFTAKDNNIVIHLPDAPLKKYTAKFFDENDSLIFELNKINEDYLIIEKVNFVHAGWFHFEIYESGDLIEKNRFQIMHDVRTGNR